MVTHFTEQNMAEFIDYAVTNNVGTITINRPQARNAMTFAMLGDFIRMLGEAGADKDAKVIVVTGVPGAFCAGTDLKDLSTIPGEKRGLRGTAEERSKWWPIVECPKPVIGAIDGPAVGMGAEFTSQCDVRLCSPNARFAWNFAHRGLVPDTGAGSWLLPRLIGVQRAMKLLYTGDFLPAEEALTIGYVDEIVPSDQLLSAAQSLGERIAKNSPFSHERMKALVYEGLGADVADHMTRHTKAMAECFASDDHREGVASFLERREANF
ncbi:MAG: enoyl-CoA hydratase/carnithine racemase, partial [Candidatus Azotimanducaceae bacterium]